MVIGKGQDWGRIGSGVLGGSGSGLGLDKTFAVGVGETTLSKEESRILAAGC